MEAWRRVEVAACEEMDGPTAADLEAIRAATFTVEAVQRREEITDHDVAAFVDVLSGERGPGRALDPLRADELRRPRHRARRCSCRRRATIVVAGARELAAALAERAREHVDTRLRRPHARRPRRADDVRHQARGLRDGGAPQRAAPRARVRAGGGRRALGRGRHVRRRTRPRSRRAVLARLGLARRAGLHAGRPARPPRRAAAGDRARRRRPRAPRDRDPPPAAHRGPRGVRAVPLRRAEGLERDAPQAQPDHERAHHRPRARPARQRAGGGRERRAVARARHLALRRRARDPARLHDPPRLPAAPRAAARARARRRRGADARATSTSRTARCSPSGCCSRSSRRAWSATRPTGSSRRRRSARGTRASRCATCSSGATSASTSTRSSTSRAYTRHAAEIVARLDVESLTGVGLTSGPPSPLLASGR